MKDRKWFSDQINRNPIDTIFARRDCICSNTKDLRSLNSAVNKLIKQSGKIFFNCVLLSCHIHA